VSGTLVGYARCSTAGQDLTAQRQTLRALGVAEQRIYLDHGLTGRHRDRPGLALALAAVREGDTLVVPKLDRLARSVPDARAIADELERRGARLQLGASVHDPRDPMGKMFFNVLATFAGFEADLLSLRTREGMLVAKAKGRLKGKPPKLSAGQQAHLIKLLKAGEHSIPELAELFAVSRATVYRVIQRAERARLAPRPVTDRAGRGAAGISYTGRFDNASSFSSLRFRRWSKCAGRPAHATGARLA
jgi:DNA invertase Pin-like site-specific DNA recombinase